MDTPQQNSPQQTPPPPPGAAPATPPEPNLDALMGQAGTTSWTPGGTPPASGTTPGKKKGNKGMMIAGVLLLLILLPGLLLGVKTVNDIRNRAAFEGGVYGGGTPTPTGGGSCSGPLQSCETQSCCDGQNLVCQGVSGSRVCQVSSDTSCPGSTCSRVLAFRCSQLTSGQCRENPQTFSSWAEGVAYAGSCGQVDMVCAGGSKENQLCSNFTIFNQCGGGQNTPTPTNPSGATNTPTPTNPPGVTNTPTPTPLSGQCQDIKIYKNDATVDPSTLKPGDSIVIAVAGANATKARVKINGADWVESASVNSSGEYTFSYTIPASGVTNFDIVAQLFIGDQWR